jgi:hypothetical protein
MSDAVNLLMREFLVWVASRPRTYADAMEAWQSTCPRHTLWEDALIEGFIEVQSNGIPHEFKVMLTARGRAVLDGQQ